MVKIKEGEHVKTALIKTTTASQSDCSNMSAVTGIEIVSTEPARTAARYAVSVAGGTWKKLFQSLIGTLKTQLAQSDGPLGPGFNP